jgi:putative PEP-CTERM system histidine kinase
MISDIGYSLNSLAHFALLLLLFTVRKPGLAKHLLVLATATTVFWSSSMISALFGPISLSWLLTVDVLKQLAWLLFLAGCLQDNFTSIRQVLIRPATLVILLPAAIALILPNIIWIDASWRYLALIVLSLEVLILLEVLYRQADNDQWAYKPLVLYLGATHLFEFVTYANATMVNQVEVGYIAARGYIYFLLIPFLIVSIRRISHWGVDIFISRDVVLHSSLLLVAGAYLFIMAIIGYAINYLGGSWGAMVQIILVAMSLALLATVFLSNSFRTKCKVFITKHFFANQFDYRVEWVKLTKTLSNSMDSQLTVYECALQGILKAIKYDSGKLYKCSQTDFELMAEIQPLNQDGEHTHEGEILRTLTDYTKSHAWFIDISEYMVKPFNYKGLNLNRDAIKQWGYQFYLPLYKHDELWGFALLAPGEKETVHLNWEVRDYLTAITEQVSVFIFHHEAAEAVAENAQFAAFNRMSAFVVHDLKNVLAQVDLILANAAQHKHNPEFIDDTFETLTHTKARMDKMLKQLTEKKIDNQGAHTQCNLSQIAKEVVNNRCAGIRPLPTIHVAQECGVKVDKEKVSNVLYHLISNAQQATDEDGRIDIVFMLDAQHNQQLVLIEDSGCGMDSDFVDNRLFKPFDTTKGNAGMGIGAYDAKTYMDSIGGKLSVQSEPGKGSCFTLAFPVN